MKIIYVVVAVIFSAISWICTQTVWEYQYILQYIAMFLASWFICLVFVYQEEREVSKEYTIFAPCNFIYVAIIVALLVIFRNYVKDWETSSYSFWKLWIIINGIQGVFIMVFYKVRDWYHHM